MGLGMRKPVVLRASVRHCEWPRCLHHRDAPAGPTQASWGPYCDRMIRLTLIALAVLIGVAWATQRRRYPLAPSRIDWEMVTRY
jgi:hypothetical protein